MIKDIDLTPSCSFLDLAGRDATWRLRVWGDPERAQASVLLVHGLGAQSAWFEAMARQLVLQGLLVYAYDQRGFGTRGGEAVLSYTDWIDDLAFLVKKLRESQSEQGRPFVLLGNSMGALVAMAALQGLSVDGIVICSPGFEGNNEIFTIPYRIKSIISAIFAPDKDIKLPYRVDLVTRDLSVRAWLDNDHEKKMAVPGRMLFELLKLSKLSNLKTVNVPVLMFTAGVERIVDNQVNKRIFAKLQAPAKQHIHMAEAWHDLMFDPQVDEVAEQTVSWIRSLKGSGKSAVSQFP